MNNDEEKCPETVKDVESPPDPLTKNIMTIHYIFLICVGYIILFILVKLTYKILKLFGFKISIKQNEFTKTLKNSFWIAFIICCFISTLLFVILFWIFIHWLIIIFFVPIIIIFPIPIFPFIFILPLQPLMLELIPPFKVLTNTGTLPTMLKIFKRLFSNEFITDTLNYFLYPSINDVNKYFYNNIKQLISEMFYYNIENVYNIPPEKCKTSKQDIINTIKPDDNIKDEEKYNEYKEISNVEKTMKKIEEDTELCVSMHHKFKEYNSSYLSDVSTDTENSFSPYNLCYKGAIKSYLKTSITQ